MLQDNSLVKTAPSVSAQVIEFRNKGVANPVLSVENLSADTATTLVVKESSDGVVWTDVSGLESTALAAGDSTSLSISSALVYLALWANNSVDLKIDLRRYLATVANLD